MFADESGRLHKHAARPAAGVVHAAAEGLKHLDQRAHNAGRRVEFAGQLAFGFGKLGEAVFVGAAQDVFRVAMLLHLNVGEEVHHVAQPPLVQLGTGKILGQDALQARVFFLDQAHGVVYRSAHFGCVSRFGHDLPTGFLWHEEDVFGRIFVLVFLEAVAFVHQFVVFHLEAVRYVFQENQSQHHGFVLRSVEISTQQVCRLPYFFLKTYLCCIVCLSHIYFCLYYDKDIKHNGIVRSEKEVFSF